MTGNPTSSSGFEQTRNLLDNRVGHGNSVLGSVSERDSWSPWQREAYALGGIGDGIGQSVSDAFGKDLGSTAMKVGGAAVLGGGLAYLRESCSLGKVGAMVIGAGFLYATAKDLIAHAAPTYQALKEAANSSKNLDQNRATVAAAAGPFAVDFALTSAGGMFGAGTVSTMRSISRLPEVTPTRSIVPAVAESPKAALAPSGTSIMESSSIGQVPGAQNVYSKVLPSMLKIESMRPTGLHTGTGLVVSEDGYALTDFHVVAHSDPDGLFAITSDGSKYHAVVEKADPGIDLALIRLGKQRFLSRGRSDFPNEPFVPAELADSNPLPGQEVYAMGYGGQAVAQSPKLSHGRVTALEAAPTNVQDLPSTMRPTEQVVRSQVELEPGFSGGPLVARSGDVVAINFARNETDPNSFAVPAETMRRFLESRPPVDYAKFVPMLKTAARSIDGGPSWAGKEAELRALYDKASKGVVQIMSDGTASGATPVYSTAFAVDPFYLVAHSDAVGAVGSSVKVTHNGTLHDLLTVDTKFPDLKVAILRSVTRSPLNLEPVRVASASELLKGGERVAVFGYKAEQAEMTASTGQFGSYIPGFSGRNRLKTFAAVDDGYTGAPVFNRLGRVVSMTPMVGQPAAESNNIHFGDIRQAMRLAELL